MGRIIFTIVMDGNEDTAYLVREDHNGYALFQRGTFYGKDDVYWSGERHVSTHATAAAAIQEGFERSGWGLRVTNRHTW